MCHIGTLHAPWYSMYVAQGHAIGVTGMQYHLAIYVGGEWIQQHYTTGTPEYPQGEVYAGVGESYPVVVWPVGTPCPVPLAE